MPETDATKTDATPAGDAGPDLTKLTKAELVEELNRARARGDELVARVVSMEDSRERRVSPEHGFVITALIALHRETANTAPGVSTIRGRNAPVAAKPRYLDAARALGDDLVNDILGPVKSDDAPAR